ncbi:MAG: DM13 domain-containing protein [Chthonomonas sp.]|nr:DM13 domain-containing protein [Chthonomonas sp.]
MQAKTKHILLAVGAPAVVLGWYAFRPELAFVNKHVQESLPVSSSQAIQQLGKGMFASYAHETTGMAEILRVDGKPILRLSNFKTSNGPDVHVLLTRSDDPKIFDNGSALDLGVIKGNEGDQNYTLPNGTMTDQYESVTIWCKRFNVSFGGAKIEPTAKPISFNSSQTSFQTISAEIRVTSGSLRGGGFAGLFEANNGRVLSISEFRPKGLKAADVYLVKAERLGKSYDFNSLTKVKLGTWKAGKRTQQFAVSKEIDAWLYRSVILFNPETRKPIATASLRSDQERTKKASLL